MATTSYGTATKATSITFAYMTTPERLDRHKEVDLMLVEDDRLIMKDFGNPLFAYKSTTRGSAGSWIDVNTRSALHHSFLALRNSGLIEIGLGVQGAGYKPVVLSAAGRHYLDSYTPETGIG